MKFWLGMGYTKAPRRDCCLFKKIKDSIIIDIEELYLIKVSSAGVFWRLLRIFLEEF